MELPGDTLQRRAERLGYLEIKDTGVISFYENPRITEKKRGGYTKTYIYRRREPLRLWVGSTVFTMDLEIKFTLPHIASIFGDISLVEEAIATARASVEPISDNIQNGEGPGIAQLVIEGSILTYPPCIVTSYEIANQYENGAYGTDSRVIMIRLTLEEFNGYKVGDPTGKNNDPLPTDYKGEPLGGGGNGAGLPGSRARPGTYTF